MSYNSKGIAYVTCQWTLTLLALVIVPLRVYSRAFLTRSFGSDDLFIIIPLVGVTSMIRPATLKAETEYRY